MFAFLFGLSGIINILALTSAFYMLQIYDRALTSGSVPTLLALSVLAIGLYLFQGMFDVIRSQILVRLGARLDRRIAPMAHQVAIDMPRFGFSTAEALERGRDVDTVRGFLGSQGPIALFDLPWMPVYLVFVYMLHPWLGGLTLAGAFVLTLLTIATELMTRRLSASTHKAVIERNAIADSNARNADVLKAMGFTSRAVGRFNRANAEHLALQTRTNDISGHLRRHLARAAHAPAIGAARARRLSDHHRRTVGRRHHRLLGGGHAGAGTRRPRHRQLEERGRRAQRLAAAQGDGGRPRRHGRSRWRCPTRQGSLKVEKITVAAPGIRPRADQRGRVRAQGRPGARRHRPVAAAARRRWSGRSPASGRCCAAACGSTMSSSRSGARTRSAAAWATCRRTSR